jgi:hypothetical protein
MPIYDPNKYKSLYGTQTAAAAQGAVTAPIPTGRTADQLNRSKSLAANTTRQGAEQGKAALARNLGGTTSPLYAMLSANMDLSGQAASAGIASDVDAAEAQRAQELEMARRQQMLQLGGLGQQVAGLQASTQLSAESNQMQQQNINNSMLLGQSGLALQSRNADLSAELGRGDLALRRELGQGQLSLGRAQLGANTALGQMSLQQRAQEAQQQFQLGMMRLQMQQEQMQNASFFSYPGGG